MNSYCDLNQKNVVTDGRKRVSPLRNWRNGVVVRIPNQLSNAVMTFPALFELKKILPEYCGLFVIIPAFMTQLFEALTIVDKTIPLRNANAMWSKKERRKVLQLRAGAIVLFNESAKDVISARLSRVPKIFSFSGTGCDMLLTGKIPRPANPDNPEHHSHLAMQYLELVKLLGAGEWDGVLPKISSRIATNETDPQIRDICRHPQILLVAPGFSGTQCWPAENYKKVADYWIRHGGIVVVLGSASERVIGSAVISGLPKKKCFNLCGKTDICALLHLFRSAAYTIAGDSGLMRLGIALDVHGLVPVGPYDFSHTDPVTEKWQIISSRSKNCAKNCPGINCKRIPTAMQAIRMIRKAAQELHFPFRKAAKKYS